MNGEVDDPDTYERLGARLQASERRRRQGCNRLYYLALPPTAFATVVERLGGSGLTRKDAGCGWRRVIVEKPFGTDLASARELNRRILAVLDEDQIYRIDHYLGKETVQNIMVLRFANGLFEPIWNRDHIDHVQITVAETVGVGAARPVLRRDRRAAGHGAQPSVPAPVAHRHGAALPLRGWSGARREGRGARRGPGSLRGRRDARPLCAPSTLRRRIRDKAIRATARRRTSSGKLHRDLCAL